MSEMRSGQATCFLCDQNLGRLARWLRILGFDAEYMQSWNEERVKTARLENRIILTRNHSLASHESAVLVRSDHVQEQLHELAASVDLKAGYRPFSRCCVCNNLLEAVSREEVRSLVPEYTYQTQERFSRCPSCTRIYWKGSHHDRASRIVSTIVSPGMAT
ncbi:MAG TPA: hypothetical protein ENN34_09965 [Deltaproteobacteria bacterium]|nr:hypothetical protein [Deltaproteobacteria bacterium]